METETKIVTITFIKPVCYFDRAKRARILYVITDAEENEYKVFGKITGRNLITQGNTVKVSYVEENSSYYLGEVDRVVRSIVPVEADAEHVSIIKDAIKRLTAALAEYEKATANV